MTGKSPNNGNTKDVEIMVPVNYLRNFWKTLEMPLINCEVNLVLTWSSACVITNSTGAGRFAITDTKRYVPVVTLSTQDNKKLLQQFIGTNIKQTYAHIQRHAQNRYLNHLVDPNFQGVNRLFVLSFENEDDERSHSNYYLPNIDVKKYNVMTDGKNFFFNQ